MHVSLLQLMACCWLAKREPFYLQCQGFTAERQHPAILNQTRRMNKPWKCGTNIKKDPAANGLTSSESGLPTRQNKRDGKKGHK